MPHKEIMKQGLSLVFVKDYRNSKGNLRPWILKDVETDSIAASFESKDVALKFMAQLSDDFYQ